MATTERVDNLRLTGLERVAMDLWPVTVDGRAAVLDLCADLRAARGLPQTPGVYPDSLGGPTLTMAAAETDRPETIEETRERERIEDLVRVQDDFTWHPVLGERLEHIKAVGGLMRDLAEQIVIRAPRNRNRSLALTKLEEARMHFNAAAAKGEQP